jgi:ribose 5-phosphate isomerase B
MAQRFGIITEADARNLPVGSIVELEKGGHITPLAQDTLRERRVTVLVGGSIDPNLPADLAPVSPARRIAIGCDHTGLVMKDALIAHFRKQGLTVTDYGTNTPSTVDYPDIAGRVAKAVARSEADAGIVIDGAGIGSTIAANKIRGIRAAMCLNLTITRYAREHNGANVAALGSTMISVDEALAIVDVFVTTPTREPRYLRRLLKVRELEDGSR